MLVPHVVLWTVAHCILSAGLCWTCCVSSILPDSWNTLKPMFFEILKDPYLFWSSFFEGLFKWIFLFSNHMLSPTFNPWGFFYFLSNCFFIISYTTSIDFVASFQLLCRPVRKASNIGNSICATRLPFYGYLPKLSLNSVLSIVMNQCSKG